MSRIMYHISKMLAYLGSQRVYSHPLRVQGIPPASQSYWQNIPCKTLTLHLDQTLESHLP